jgi:hypothetical protein
MFQEQSHAAATTGLIVLCTIAQSSQFQLFDSHVFNRVARYGRVYVFVAS